LSFIEENRPRIIEKIEGVLGYKLDIPLTVDPNLIPLEL